LWFWTTLRSAGAGKALRGREGKEEGGAEDREKERERERERGFSCCGHCFWTTLFKSSTETKKVREVGEKEGEGEQGRERLN
jgi:hypothetical protein